MDRIPSELRDILIEHGYDTVEILPNNSESTRWANVQQDCGLSNPALNKVINAIFPGNNINSTPLFNLFHKIIFQLRLQQVIYFIPVLIY